jgi:Lipocalin-like domain
MDVDAATALLGSWRLQAWTITDDSGTRHPFGESATGSIMYTADGRMSAVVSAADRPRLPGIKPRDATDGELAAAFLSFFCYAGTWHLDGDTVVHSVDLSVNPNLVGTEQRRRMTFTDGATRLELSADEPGPRGTRTHGLQWHRT